MAELKQTIDTAKSSAPDLNQIDYAIVKCLPLEYLTMLLDIYNRLFDKGTFPEDWTHAMVILIPKQGSHGFRPISLLSCLFKIMEKIIYW